MVDWALWGIKGSILFDVVRGALSVPAARLSPGAMLGAVALLHASVAQSAPDSELGCHQRPPQVAIIIDDIGYRQTEGLRALALPANVSYSVLPHSPHGPAFAKRAHALQREVLLHLPMQSRGGKALGPGGLKEAMTATEVRQTLRDALVTVPSAQGVSNHMGSHLTAQHAAMTTLMFFVQKHRLFFVDSVTTSDTVAYDTAKWLGIPSIKRDVFLDHEPAPTQIRSQFERLVRLALRHGTALGLAHPYPSTMDVLVELLVDTERLGVELVSASALIRQRSCLEAASRGRPLESARQDWRGFDPPASRLRLTASR